jgi:hypothetical protein
MENAFRGYKWLDEDGVREALAHHLNSEHLLVALLGVFWS